MKIKYLREILEGSFVIFALLALWTAYYQGYDRGIQYQKDMFEAKYMSKEDIKGKYIEKVEHEKILDSLKISKPPQKSQIIEKQCQDKVDPKIRTVV